MYSCKTTIFWHTTESPKVISDNSLVHGFNKVKVEPENFHDSSKKPAKGNEVTPNSSESLQCYNGYSKKRNGEFKCIIS